MSDWNDAVIEQFRAGEPRIADRFDQRSLLLLHTTGARSGEPRVHPVARFDLAGRTLVVASYAGRPEHPAWFHNLLTHPEVSVELWQQGELRTIAATATELPRAQRDEAWVHIVAEMPGFADYETKTDRLIPVVELVPTT